MSHTLPTEMIGTVKEIYACDPDTFFSAALFHEDTLGLKVRVRGNVLLGPKERIRIRGYWVLDARFGPQFQIEDFDYIGVPPWKKA